MKDMISEYLSIKDASVYSGLKKSYLYSRVEAGNIPHYKFGRMIRFKREELDHWMQGHRVDAADPGKQAQQILRSTKGGPMDIDRIVKKTIAEVNGNEYTTYHGKPDRIKGLRKEVSHGSL